MKIEFTDEQLALLKEVLAEYADQCYEDMFAYQHAAVDAQDPAIEREYAAFAQSEEDHFQKVRALADYVVRYEELMRGV